MNNKIVHGTFRGEFNNPAVDIVKSFFWMWVGKNVLDKKTLIIVRRQFFKSQNLISLIF
jgi:hypothetical protein